MSKSRVFCYDMRKIRGRYDAGSMTPGVIDIVANSRKEADKMLLEEMPSLLAGRGVVKDVTSEYVDLSLYNDGDPVEADIGVFEIEKTTVGAVAV